MIQVCQNFALSNLLIVGSGLPQLLNLMFLFTHILENMKEIEHTYKTNNSMNSINISKRT